MMSLRGTIILGAALMASVSLPVAAELDMVEGHWETIVQVQIQGSNFPVPAIKSSRCLTRDDPVPNAQSNMRCQVSEQTVNGNDVSWRVQCGDDKATMNGAGKVTYAGDSFSGVLDMQISEIKGDRSMQIKYTLGGTRLRACDAPR